jgi:hypothetical protein
MLFHVVHEVVKQLDLLLQGDWELLQCVVVLHTFKVDVVNIAVRKKII